MNSTRNIALKDQAAKLQLRDENWGYVVFDGETGNNMYLPVMETDKHLRHGWCFTCYAGFRFDKTTIYRRLIDVGEGNVLVGLDEKMERVEGTYNGLDWCDARWFSKTPREVRDHRAQCGLLPIICFRRRKEAETLGAASQLSTSPSTPGGQEPDGKSGSSGGSLVLVNANEWVDATLNPPDDSGQYTCICKLPNHPRVVMKCVYVHDQGIWVWNTDHAVTHWLRITIPPMPPIERELTQEEKDEKWVNGLGSIYPPKERAITIQILRDTIKYARKEKGEE